MAQIGGLMMLACVMVALPQMPRVEWAIALMSMLGFGFFFSYSTQLSTISELVPHARSTGMAVNYFCTYVGSAVGARICGWVLHDYRFPAVGIVSAVAALAGVGLIVVVLRKRAVDTGRDAASIHGSK